MKSKVLLALSVIFACVSYSAVAENSSPSQAVYASEGCKSGCVVATKSGSTIYAGSAPRLYRVCIGSFSATLRVDGVDREIHSPSSNFACADFMGKTIVLVSGDIKYGLLP